MPSARAPRGQKSYPYPKTRYKSPVELELVRIFMPKCMTLRLPQADKSVVPASHRRPRACWRRSPVRQMPTGAGGGRRGLFEGRALCGPSSAACRLRRRHRVPNAPGQHTQRPPERETPELWALIGRKRPVGLYSCVQVRRGGSMLQRLRKRFVLIAVSLTMIVLVGVLGFSLL